MASPNSFEIPLIETGQIEENYSSIGVHFLSIVEEFKKEIAQRLENINSGQLSFEEMASEFHVIKSSSGNLGMARLSQASRVLMKMAENKDPETAKEAEKLTDLYNESLIGLDALLADFFK